MTSEIQYSTDQQQYNSDNHPEYGKHLDQICETACDGQIDDRCGK